MSDTLENHPLKEDDSINSEVETTPEMTFYFFKGPLAEKMSVVLLGLGFMFLFAAFNTTSNYSRFTHANAIVSDVHKDMGYISLAVLYGVFGISNFFAPTIENFLGPRLSMVLAATLYTTYTLFAAFNYKWTLIVSSILVGFAASILWVGQGDYLTKISGKNMGTNSGIFLGIFFLSMIVGNLLIATLFLIGASQLVSFLILSAVGVFGVFLICLLRPAPNVPSKTDKMPVLESIYGTFAFLMESKMVLLMGLIAYSGFINAVMTGKIPEIIGKEAGRQYIGYTMATFGLAEFIGSFFFGYTGDKLGRKIMIVFTLLCHIVAISWTFVMSKYPPYFFFVATFLNGFADSGLNTNMYAILGNVFKDQPSNAFAAFKLIQSLAFTVGFVACIYLKFFALQVISYFLIVLALYLFLILDFYVEPVK